jgi:hypothetical protein
MHYQGLSIKEFERIHGPTKLSYLVHLHMTAEIQTYSMQPLDDVVCAQITQTSLLVGLPQFGLIRVHFRHRYAQVSVQASITIPTESDGAQRHLHNNFDRKSVM